MLNRVVDIARALDVLGNFGGYVCKVASGKSVLVAEAQSIR
jgi:hypothetical protein